MNRHEDGLFLLSSTPHEWFRLFGKEGSSSEAIVPLIQEVRKSGFLAQDCFGLSGWSKCSVPLRSHGALRICDRLGYQAPRLAKALEGCFRLGPTGLSAIAKNGRMRASEASHTASSRSPVQMGHRTRVAAQ